MFSVPCDEGIQTVVLKMFMIDDVLIKMIGRLIDWARYRQ